MLLRTSIPAKCWDELLFLVPLLTTILVVEAYHATRSRRATISLTYLIKKHFSWLRTLSTAADMLMPSIRDHPLLWHPLKVTLGIKISSLAQLQKAWSNIKAVRWWLRHFFASNDNIDSKRYELDVSLLRVNRGLYGIRDWVYARKTVRSIYWKISHIYRKRKSIYPNSIMRAKPCGQSTQKKGTSIENESQSIQIQSRIQSTRWWWASIKTTLRIIR